jgi:hypothetical protein
MNLLLGEIWKSISSTLRNEDLYPKKENLRIREIDNHFFIQHKRRFLFVFHIWEYMTYNDIGSEDIPMAFNSYEETVKFIDEISCN